MIFLHLYLNFTDQRISPNSRYVIRLALWFIQLYLDYVNDSLSEVQDKISDMEDRSRRNNIRIDGVTEEKEKTWDNSM